MNEAHLEFCGGPVWQQMVEEMVLPAVLRDYDLGDDVIEIGPGPGFTTDGLRTRTKQLTAVELDPNLAAALADRLAGTNVEVRCRNATDLDLPTGRFTTAVSCNMLHHVPTAEEQNRILAELGRVLRPGGLLIAADSAPRDQLDDFHAGDTWNPIDPTELPTRLEAAGFESVDVQSYELGWTCAARAIA